MPRPLVSHALATACVGALPRAGVECIKMADDDYEYGEADEFQNEYDVGARTEWMPRDVLAELGILRKSERPDIAMISDPLQRFYRNVAAVAPQIWRDGIVAKYSTDALLDAIKSVDHARYKNPTAFALGYALTVAASPAPRGAGDVAAVVAIDKVAFDRVVDGIRSGRVQFLDATVRPQDVLRYCFMWIAWAAKRRASRPAPR
jgi:Family of unknown function (DUF5770)